MRHRAQAHALAATFQQAAARADWDDAVAALDGLIALEPSAAPLHYNKAVALRRAGLADKAIAAARDALARDPFHTRALFELAAALMDTGQLTDAASEFERYLGLVPHDAEATLNLARILLRLGHPQRSLATLRAVPGEAAAATRAEALRDLGRLGEMETALEGVGPLTALRVRTHGARGRLPLDPRAVPRPRAVPT